MKIILLFPHSVDSVLCLELFLHKKGESYFMLGKYEPFSAKLTPDALAECDQPRKIPLKYSASARDCTRAMERTDKEINSFVRCDIMTDMCITLIIFHTVSGRSDSC